MFDDRLEVFYADARRLTVDRLHGKRGHKLAALIGLRLGVSGVLAVVVAGFFVSWRVHHVPPSSRTQLFAVWDQLVFLLNAVTFLYTGIEVPALVRQTSPAPSARVDLRQGAAL